LWGHHPKQYVLHHRWLHNVKPNIMANNSLKYWRIDAAQRDTLRQQWNQPASFWWLGLLILGGVGALWYGVKQKLA
jgi:hypothetical protein